jgi:hypothetical protein
MDIVQRVGESEDGRIAQAWAWRTRAVACASSGWPRPVKRDGPPDEPRAAAGKFA